MAKYEQDTEVTLADKNVETSQFDRFKGRKNVTDRIAIVSSKLTRVWRYFHESNGKKYVFRAPQDAATLEFTKKELGEPEQRFGLVIFHYLTDEQGNMLDELKCRGKLKTWVISESRYEELSGLHRQWPLLDGGKETPQYDLCAKCTEDQFQRMTFTPMKEAHWKKKEKWYSAIKEKMTRATEKLGQALGRKMSDDEIRAILGVSNLPSQTGSTQNAGDIDMSDVMDDLE